MTTIVYGVSEEIYSLNNTTRISYGIVTYADSEPDGIYTIIASVRDVSPDRHKIEQLVDLCNRLELLPIHLNDVIEDFLAESF